MGAAAAAALEAWGASLGAGAALAEAAAGLGAGLAADSDLGAVAPQAANNMVAEASNNALLINGYSLKKSA